MSEPANGLQWISTNLSMADPAIRKGVAAFNTDSVLHGNSYVTVISHEYEKEFSGGIYYIMQGLAIAAMGPVEMSDGSTAQATIFGFTTNFANSAPRTALIVPNIHRAFVSKIDDPMGAIHSYHQGLVRRTNEALQTLKLPYLLAPVPE